MGKAEKYSSNKDQENTPRFVTLKKKLAAASLAVAAGFGVLAGCGSSEHGSSVSSTIGSVVPAGNNEVLNNKTCAERDDLYAAGTYSWDGVSVPDEPYSDLETMKENIEIPDGVGGRGTVGPPIDLSTLTDSQNKQLWDSYQAYMNNPDAYREDIKSGTVLLYGDKGRVEEYGEEGYPDSASDGVIDSDDLKICIVGSNWREYIESENFIGGKTLS